VNTSGKLEMIGGFRTPGKVKTGEGAAEERSVRRRRIEGDFTNKLVHECFTE
jgi:hypothetical protein